jgi:hypothetical protein
MLVSGYIRIQSAKILFNAVCCTFVLMLIEVNPKQLAKAVRDRKIDQ